MKKKVLISLAAMFAVLMTTPLALTAQAADQNTELTMTFITFGPVPQEMQRVQDELNKLLSKKIGATVKLLPINAGAWAQQANLMLASGENLDLMIDGTLGFFTLSSHVSKNQLLPLDDLVAKYGQGISKSMDSVFLNAGKVNGKLYILPVIHEFGGNFVICMRKDIVDKLKIDVSKIKTYNDVEATLLKVKKAYPDVVPLVPQDAQSTIVKGMHDWDRLGIDIGAIADSGATLKVVDIYETKEYADLIKRAHKWYQEGLILKDAATSKDDWSTYVKANRAFAFLGMAKPGFDVQESLQVGQPMVTAELIPPYCTTDNVIDFGWTIPRNSKNPEKAMQLLNLLYSDPEVFNLLVYGTEGKDYVKIGNNMIDFPKGLDSNSVGYSLSGYSWELGNQFQGYVFKGNTPTIWEDTKAFNGRALKSKALGFVFDSTPVKDEVAACQNVLNRYVPGLEMGVLDPRTLTDFIAKLKAAGGDKIIAEKQRQIDAWANANGMK